MTTIDIFQLKKDSKIHAVDPTSGRAFCARNIVPDNPHMRETVEGSKAVVNCMCCSSYLEQYLAECEAFEYADKLLEDVNKMVIPAALAQTRALLQEVKGKLEQIEKALGNNI